MPWMCWAQGTQGLSFGKQEAKTGWNAQPTCTVNLDAVRVPAEAMLGGEGQGFSIAMNACEQHHVHLPQDISHAEDLNAAATWLEGNEDASWLHAVNGGRINIGACSLGGAAFCLDAAQEHAAVRKQFGQPIGSFQAIQFRLADMATHLHSARLMVRCGLARTLVVGSRLEAKKLPQQMVWARCSRCCESRHVNSSAWQRRSQSVQIIGGQGSVRTPLARRHAAESMDRQAPSATLDAAMAKRYATEAGCHIADDAMQVGSLL